MCPADSAATSEAITLEARREEAVRAIAAWIARKPVVQDISGNPGTVVMRHGLIEKS